MLESTKAKMRALLEGIAKLDAYLQEKEEEKRRMEEDINQCLARMDRAHRWDRLGTIMISRNIRDISASLTEHYTLIVRSFDVEYNI